MLCFFSYPYQLGLQFGSLLRFAIGEGGLSIVDGKLEKADLHYLGKSNRARAFADSHSKVCKGINLCSSTLLGGVCLTLILVCSLFSNKPV